MPDLAEAWIFWPFAVLLLLFAAGVLVARNPVYAAMSLVGAFFCLAVLYVLLAAHLVAFLQIMVYAGAVMVLFLFVIMLLSLSEEELGAHVPFWHTVSFFRVLGAGGAVALGALVWRCIRELDVSSSARLPNDFGTVRAVGHVLFTQYLLPFEATSLLLLVAIVGAVVVAKQRI